MEISIKIKINDIVKKIHKNEKFIKLVDYGAIAWGIDRKLS